MEYICNGKSRQGFECLSHPTFGVGLIGSDLHEWRGACAQHLAQVVRAQIKRLNPTPRSMVVAPLVTDSS
jgi:hypothetical protein